MSVLVVTEQQGGKWHKMSWEALAGGQQTAASLGGGVDAAVLGADVGPLARELAACRVDEVFAVEHELLERYSPDGYTLALRQLLDQVKPNVVLFPHTYQVRDFGPKLAASLGRPFLSDAIGAKYQDGELVFVRQLFQGKLNADVTLSGEPPFFVSLQSGAFRADQLQKAETPAAVTQVEVALKAEDIRTRPGEPFRESKGEVRALTQARVDNSVDRAFRSFLTPDLLILDDLGLHGLTAQQSADLYELILNRHRASSFIITSNRAVDEWLGLFDDPILGNSALDRLANASYQIVIEGASYRNGSRHTALCWPQRG